MFTLLLRVRSLAGPVKWTSKTHSTNSYPHPTLPRVDPQAKRAGRSAVDGGMSKKSLSWPCGGSGLRRRSTTSLGMSEQPADYAPECN